MDSHEILNIVFAKVDFGLLATICGIFFMGVGKLTISSILKSELKNNKSHNS